MLINYIKKIVCRSLNMATQYGQGAPGVRIRLIDNSQVTLVNNPRITAGIVGYSSKGEFNKIIDITSSADQDTILGNGFNNPKFNQGMYATRAIVNGNGYVEFVRPYGEAVVSNDVTKQDLKTDTFAVAFDYNTASPTSIDMHHYASTRHIADGLVGMGVRKIYTVADAITHNTNVDFELDADSMTDSVGGNKKAMMFAIMNSDPTAANRAGEKFTITDIRNNGTTGTVNIITSSASGVSAGDTIYIGGTVDFNGQFEVVSTVDTTNNITINSAVVGYETTGAIFVNNDTSTSGVDYLSVKTVASGKASKKFESFKVIATTTDYNVTLTDLVLPDSNLYTKSEAMASTAVTGETASTSNNFTVSNASGLLVGDKVIFRGTTIPAELNATSFFTVSNVAGTSVMFAEVLVVTSTLSISDCTMYNVTGAFRNISLDLNSLTYGYTTTPEYITSGVSNTMGALLSLDTGTAALFNVDDIVSLSNDVTQIALYKIASIDLLNNTITIKDTVTDVLAPVFGTFDIVNLTKSGIFASVGANGVSLDLLSKFGLIVSASQQDNTTTLVGSPSMTSTIYEGIMETVDGIVIDSTVGREFLNLGLATESYQDIDMSGETTRVFILTTEGKLIARIYVMVTYYFAGETYQFAGTIAQYVYNGQNLYLKDVADNVANGWTLVINDNISLENAVLDPAFSLSNSLIGGTISSETVMVAFDETDPAIVNNAIWEYDPRNNSTSAILSNAWNLFLNKDEAYADMLVSAGTAVTNLFVKGQEQLNFVVIDAMLGICEKRKDLFAIFDGLDEPKIKNALVKMSGIGSEGDIARWGAIFDGRSIFFDSVYTKLNVESVKSIEVASIITNNRASNVYWLPPAGYDYGRIPAILSKKQKFVRTYNYADDQNSDIARLYDANINPTRVNDQGMFIYGQKTMLKRSTALNRLNVIMLVAGIHKRFSTYLDKKIFQLNTASLRTNIQSDLQAQIDLIKSSNPAGLTAGVVICDNTNNTPDIIDTNQLIVDVILQPTRAVEFITLRTTVQRTGDKLTISSNIVGG